MKKMVKDFCFGLWGAFWVIFDEIREALNEMSALHFAKLLLKGIFYSLCVVGWILVFFGITFVGWAII